MRTARHSLASRLLIGWMLLAPVCALAAASDPAPPTGWELGWSDLRCSVTRRSEAAPAATFTLRTLPGSGTWQVHLASSAWSRTALGDLRRLTISLQSSGALLPDRRTVARSPAGEMLVVHQLPPSLVELLAAADSIRVAREGEVLFDMPLTGAAQAVAAIRQCEMRFARVWGIDPVAYAAIRVPPAGDIAAVVHDGDYPPAALRVRASGTVAVRLMVDANGRVSSCTPVVSSGHELLDRRACEIYRERLRLTPAIGADGAPTAAPMIATLRWLLPR